MENIYDLAILGAGPAGICAAIYATRAKLNTIWLDKKFVQGGQIVDTYEEIIIRDCRESPVWISGKQWQVMQKNWA